MNGEQWLGIELRHLAALSAVARKRSFRAAAAELGYVPSAISSQIATLERVVGTRLVERSRGPSRVRLTEAGELLLAHAESILSRLQAAQADLREHVDGAPTALRVGITQSVGVRILPSLMQRYSERWPQVQLRPREAAADLELYEGVERGELELAFVELPVPEGPFEAFALMTDPYVLLVRADEPIATAGRPAEVEDLAARPLISFAACRGMSRVEATLEARGAEPNVVVRSDVNATVQALVAAGVGAAIVPRLAVDESDRMTAIVEFGSSLTVPPRTLALAWHRDRAHTPAVRDFVELAQEVAAGIGRGGPALLRSA
ncbi:MAG TPA: LysR family transcriptional regulator [Gaiellaceae bacterium]|jgi:DNA-binding transcriptional LysR family regulator|nr:LysR family transcriptional regulator [Gaiellaceae bacterium]